MPDLDFIRGGGFDFNFSGVEYFGSAWLADNDCGWHMLSSRLSEKNYKVVHIEKNTGIKALCMCGYAQGRNGWTGRI
ncbi:hypothetical protein TUM17576_51180 [Enterobacter hormaechei]|nr:hypothetical protein TUM17576_51180 [Enterobacter hormaechei]